jgi:hypothetical protein
MKSTTLLIRHAILKVLKTIKLRLKYYWSEFSGADLTHVVGKPTAIIARTIKGHPLTIQDKNGFHGKPISAEDMPKQLKILDDKYVNLKCASNADPKNLHLCIVKAP